MSSKTGLKDAIATLTGGEDGAGHPISLVCLLLPGLGRTLLVNKTLKTKIMKECIIGMEEREQKWPMLCIVP